MIERTFGTKLDDKRYSTRVGAYAIIFDEENRVATVKTKKENFLIGGKIEGLESHESCIKRESIEETGFNIDVKEIVCKSNTYSYVDSSNIYFNPISYFYIAIMTEKVKEPIEIDNELEWIDIKEIGSKMYLEHQIWAINQGIAKKLELRMN